ncbi:hypothetical protein DL98DRAFT_359098, partial [Cadophora sp. DSE1049]
RFVRISNHDETLIFTGGACLNNERANPTTGFGFAFLPRDIRVSPQVKYGTVAFRLENKSSYGSPAEQTSNRAELRAVIAALQFRAWHRVGWKRIVIATDSEYAINMTSKKVPVKNRDLWELLMKVIKRLTDQGVEVLF